MKRRDSLAVRLESLSGVHATQESLDALMADMRQSESVMSENAALREQLGKERDELAQVRQAFEKYQRLSEHREQRRTATRAATKTPNE